MEYTKPPEPERPIRYNFLTRDLSVWNENLKVLTYTKLKNVYLQRIGEKYCPISNKYYSKGKSSAYLRTLKLMAKSSPHCINLPKNAKNLKVVHIGIPINNKSSVSLVTSILKRLPKKVEVISVEGMYDNPNNVILKSFYRTLGTFRNLRRFNKSLAYSDKDAEGNWVQKEFDFIKKYMSRNQKLAFNWIADNGNQQSFQEFMKLDKACSSITKLSFSLHDEMFKSKEDDDDDDADSILSGLELNDEEENINENNYPDWILLEDERKSKIAPFFKLSLFPNLQNLKISIYGDFTYPLYPLVTKGFEYLQNLEALSLTIETRPQGMKFLFDGMLHLPLLKSFDLEIPHLKSHERTLFAQFLQKQTELIYLSLSIEKYKKTRDEYIEQDQFLENIYCCLNNKPNLKALFLQFYDWTLERMSNGLQSMGMENQLEELMIELIDGSETSSTTSSARVEGLCKFIKQQKLSLRRLNININLVTDDEIVNTLVQTISELEKLKYLSVSINFGRNYLKEYDNYCKAVYSKSVSEESLKGLPHYTKTFSYLEQALRKLNNLTSLSLLLHNDQVLNPKSSLILDVLPTLKNLRSCCLRLPFVEEAIENRIVQTIKQLNIKNITEIVTGNFNYQKDKEIEKALEPFESLYALNKSLTY